MNVVLDVVDEVLAHPYVVFWVDGDVPEMASLPDLEPAVILFSTRYLEMIAHLRAVLTYDAMSDELLEMVGEQVSLRIIAELLLRYGEPGLACHLFAESLTENFIYMVPPTLRDLEHTSISHRYLAVWFSGLLHELGHVAAPRSAADQVGDEYIDQWTDNVLAASYSDHGAMIRDLRNNRGERDALDRRVLAEEFDADLFSVQILFFAAKRVMKRNGTLEEFRSDSLAAEVFLLFAVAHIMNSCVAVARAAVVDKREAADPVGNVANAARLNVIIDFLAQDLAVSEEVVEELRGLLADVHREINERVVVFLRGHERAIRQGLYARECKTDAIGRLAEELGLEGRSVMVQTEIRRFVGLAGSLRVHHPDLDLLAEFEAWPEGAMATLAGRQRVYVVPWVTAEGYEAPFGLEANDAFVVFVFTTQRTVEYFVEESRSMLVTGFTLGITALVAPTEHNVSSTVAQALSNESRRPLQIVFEGSPSFAERIRQLNDGSFWPPPL
jgi:hypothetical protein